MQALRAVHYRQFTWITTHSSLTMGDKPPYLFINYRLLAERISCQC
jgi:hypothetical protein